MTIAATETFPAFASIPRLFRAVTITEKVEHAERPAPERAP